MAASFLRRSAARLGAAALALCTVTALAMPPALAQGATALTASDAEAWLDGLMPAALHSSKVPGAVVILVKDGKPLVQKGYGLADWDRKIAVDPAATLFRPGSVSKLVTWTAVMQLVEQGKLDLDVDLNRYLDFTMPAYQGKALTLRYVLTHTTGLEEAGRDLITYGTPTPDNGKLLKAYVPPYIYAPGSTQGYSNYATSLAGYIVERVSGQNFDDYVEQRIFAPLGMGHSTFRQPLPAAMQPHMSQGYLTRDQPALGFEIVNMPPAGSMSATGADMGRFMLAYLGQGSLDQARILKPETVALMHTQITRGLPALSGIGLGFYQQDINGHRVLAHGGDTVLFHTMLALFPDDGIGLYVSVNAGGFEDQGKWLRDRVFQGFADRYLPDQRSAPAVTVDAATSAAHAQLMAGAYRNSRRADSTFLSLLQLISPVKVDVVEQGKLAINLAGERSVFREVSPFLWQEEHGKRRIQALVENGKVRRWGLEPYVFAFVFEPVPFMAGGSVLALLGLALSVALLTVLLWPVAAILRRRHGQARPAASVAWVRLAACATVLSVLLWTWTFIRMEGLGSTGLPLALAQIATFAGFVGGLAAALWHAWRSWRGSTLAARSLALLWVLSFALLVAVGLYHKLLSVNANY